MLNSNAAVHVRIFLFKPRHCLHTCAGAGVPGWRLFGEDPDISATYYEMDAAGGAVHANQRNALLCDESKEMMYDWNKNWGCAESHPSCLIGDTGLLVSVVSCRDLPMAAFGCLWFMSCNICSTVPRVCVHVQ